MPICCFVRLFNRNVSVIQLVVLGGLVASVLATGPEGAKILSTSCIEREVKPSVTRVKEPFEV
jgi:hypothetical protein